MSPSPFRSSDREAILDLMVAAPFATLITPGSPCVVSHLPIALERSDPGSAREWGTLRGHVARGNSHWRRFDGAQEALAIFHGPHAYVSPRCYAERAAPPTWNYLVVHAYGRPECVSSGAQRRAVLDDLVARYEVEPLELCEAMRRSLEKGIVAFDFEIERVEAKFKLGQNRSPADRAGTIAALERGGEIERDLAAWTRRVTG